MWRLLLLYIVLGFLWEALAGEHGGHWGYGEKHGPEEWEGVCQTGLRQSPVDIHSNHVEYTTRFHRLHFVHYDHAGKVNVKNNGHTVSVSGFHEWESKQPYIYGGGLKYKYKLAQFHLHWALNDHEGSEHKLASLSYPAELHLVHVREGLSLPEALTKSDGIAVVGIFLAVGHDGSPFSMLQGSLRQVVHSGNETHVGSLRPRAFLPAQTEAFYRYEGSLTTPGCNEAVIWTLLAEPISITKTQLKELRQLRDEDGKVTVYNNRPTQPMSGRTILYRPNSFDQATFCGCGASLTNFSILVLLFGFLSIAQ